MSRRFTFNIPESFSPIAKGPRLPDFQLLFTAHDNLATHNDRGPMFNREAQFLSYARARGDIEDCTPPSPPTDHVNAWDKDHDDTKFWKKTQITFCFDAKGKLTHTVRAQRELPLSMSSHQFGG